MVVVVVVVRVRGGRRSQRKDWSIFRAKDVWSKSEPRVAKHNYFFMLHVQMLWRQFFRFIILRMCIFLINNYK